LKKLRELFELVYLIRTLGVGQSVAQLESFREYVEEGLEKMYQEHLRQEEDQYAVQDPDHTIGRFG